MARRNCTLQIRLTDIEEAAISALIREHGWKDRSDAVRRMMAGEATLDDGKALIGVEPKPKPKKDKSLRRGHTLIVPPGTTPDNKFTIGQFRWMKMRKSKGLHSTMALKYGKPRCRWAKEDEEEYVRYETGVKEGKWADLDEYMRLFPDPVPDLEPDPWTPNPPKRIVD